ncbi:MAG: hypothetical protein M1817_002674 [Caeruleum heppii]|nr:MAG: hypothetical protein M1817_002674 [Caeruleum heppii]
MASDVVNVLLSTFGGLGLPSTLSLQTSTTCTISDLTSQILDRLPHAKQRYIISTTSNRQLLPSSSALVSSLLPNGGDAILPLRVSVPLCGGKGGFGSQLRAAGGRMSSRKKRNQGENNGSNRNLDGRRLRTVTEAKALAEYLALKPEMERKEQAARRKHWEQTLEMVERREEEVKSGSKGKVDGKWVEDKEEAAERTREAVLAAMRSGDYKDNLLSKSTSSTAGSSGSAGDSTGDRESSSDATTPPSAAEPRSGAARTFFGFDDEDEFMSEDGSSEEEGDYKGTDEEMDAVEHGKGKQKA